ncbi:MAG: hypothetical protein QG624_431 [Pseudomonadota bacterium]|nr:hypothetical protein [Pseudomonadota bacterium]
MTNFIFNLYRENTKSNSSESYKLPDQIFPQEDITNFSEVYNFEIPPNSSKDVLNQNRGIIPGAHKQYRVANMGRKDIIAQIRWGTAVQWMGVMGKQIIPPGETKIVRNEGRAYYCTCLQLINETSSRSIVGANYAGW